MVNKYEDYMLNLIVEAVKNKDCILMFSKIFKNVIKRINHPIAKHILYDSHQYDVKHKITYLDLDDSGDDKVSFITVPKAAEYLSKTYYGNKEELSISDFARYNHTDYVVYEKGRVSTTIGRLINKLYPNLYVASGKPGEDIESFTTLFKSFRNISASKFELVNGKDIVYWYYEDNYSIDADDDTSLGNSCMKDSDSQKYIKFYAKNPDKVSLLILKDPSDDEKIYGRALVWNLTKPEGRIFMDRIYVVRHEDEQLFKNYAIEKGWLHKVRQSFQYQEIVDPLKKCDKNETLVVKDMHRNKYYPYMDSLYLYNSDLEILSNDGDYFDNYEYDKRLPEGTDKEQGLSYSDLQDADGGPSGIEHIKYYDDYFIEDDLIYCEIGAKYRRIEDSVYIPYYGEYATNDSFNNDIIECDYYYNENDKFVLKKDAIYLKIYDQYMSPDYVYDKTFVESDKYGLLRKDDAVSSILYDDYLIKKDSVEVFTTVNRGRKDWRIKGDKTYVEMGNEFFDKKIKNEV